VKCYKFQKLGHYAKEFWQGEGAKNKPSNHVNLAQDEGSNSILVLLMATTSYESSRGSSWYFNFGCSTHMTRKKDWFINLNESSKSRVHFADNSILTAEGIRRVAFKRKDGKDIVVEEVLFVPGMKTNLLSLGQLLEKRFFMRMDNNCLKVFDKY